MAQPVGDRRRELYERYQQVPEHLVAGMVRGTLEVRTLGDETDWREVRMYQGESKVPAAPEAIEIGLGGLWGGPARG